MLQYLVSCPECFRHMSIFSGIQDIGSVYISSFFCWCKLSKNQHASIGRSISAQKIRGLLLWIRKFFHSRMTKRFQFVNIIERYNTQTVYNYLPCVGHLAIQEYGGVNDR